MLRRAGVDCVILESRSRDYVENRVRAGVLEDGTTKLMEELGAADRLHREGMPDKLLDIRYHGGIIHIDMPKLTPGRTVNRGCGSRLRTQAMTLCGLTTSSASP